MPLAVPSTVQVSPILHTCVQLLLIKVLAMEVSLFRACSVSIKSTNFATDRLSMLQIPVVPCLIRRLRKRVLFHLDLVAGALPVNQMDIPEYLRTVNGLQNSSPTIPVMAAISGRCSASKVLVHAMQLLVLHDHFFVPNELPVFNESKIVCCGD